MRKYIHFIPVWVVRAQGYYNLFFNGRGSVPKGSLAHIKILLARTALAVKDGRVQVMKKYNAAFSLLKTYHIAMVVAALKHHFGIKSAEVGAAFEAGWPTCHCEAVNLDLLRHQGEQAPELTKSYILLGGANPHQRAGANSAAVTAQLEIMLRPFVKKYMIDPLTVGHLIGPHAGPAIDGSDSDENDPLSSPDERSDDSSPAEDADTSDDCDSSETSDDSLSESSSEPPSGGDEGAGAGTPAELPESAVAAPRQPDVEVGGNVSTAEALPVVVEQLQSAPPAGRKDSWEKDEQKEQEDDIGDPGDDADTETGDPELEDTEMAAVVAGTGAAMETALEATEMGGAGIGTVEHRVAQPVDTGIPTPALEKDTAADTRTPTPASGGYKLHYLRCCMAVAMLLMCIKEAGHFGDGARLATYELFDRLHYRVSKRHKYHWERVVSFVLRSKALPKAFVRQALFGGFVNLRGGRGKNIWIDQFLEHLNKFVQERKVPGRSEARDKARQLVAKLSIPIFKLMDILDPNLNVVYRAGAHKEAPLTKDVLLAASEITRAGMFDPDARFESQFGNVSANAWARLLPATENAYLRKRIKRLHDKHIAAGKGEADAVVLIP
jgi:hypothetical protein